MNEVRGQAMQTSRRGVLSKGRADAEALMLAALGGGGGGEEHPETGDGRTWGPGGRRGRSHRALGPVVPGEDLGSSSEGHSHWGSEQRRDVIGLQLLVEARGFSKCSHVVI